MKYIKGDLIDLFKQGEFDMIAHQCNCKGLFGAGIARHLASEFPQIIKEVQSHIHAVQLFGTDHYFNTEYGFIINMYSQFTVGSCTEVGIDSFEVRLGALENCLYQINKNNKGLRIGLPLIASGIAKKKSNLDDRTYFQKYVAASVRECLKDMEITIVYL